VSRTKLEDLKKGIKSYPTDLILLKDHLQAMLSKQHGGAVQVFILADIISITDSIWVNVIEGYLRRQKLYLFVEPKHYREAVRIFKEYSRENRCYHYRIVNTDSILTERMQVFDNSLAKVVATNHSAARKYADYLLGRVERVESIETISGRRTAVTADGMLYTGFTTARMNEADWRMRYIGQDSIAQQIEETERLLNREKDGISNLNTMISPLQTWVDEKTLSDEFLTNLENAVSGAKKLPELEKNCDKLHSQILIIDDSYARQLEKEQKQINRELSDLRMQGKAVVRKIGELEEQHRAYDALSEEKEQAWEKERGHFAVVYPEEDETVVGRYENELRQKGSAEKLQLDFEPALAQTKNRLNNLTQDFRQKAEIFNLRHPSASINTDMSSDEWRKSYDDIKSVQLEEFTEQVEKAKRRKGGQRRY